MSIKDKDLRAYDWEADLRASQAARRTTARRAPTQYGDQKPFDYLADVKPYTVAQMLFKFRLHPRAKTWRGDHPDAPPTGQDTRATSYFMPQPGRYFFWPSASHWGHEAEALEAGCQCFACEAERKRQLDAARAELRAMQADAVGHIAPQAARSNHPALARRRA